VDHLAARGSEDIKRFYRRIDSNLLNKIPRGHCEEVTPIELEEFRPECY